MKTLPKTFLLICVGLSSFAQKSDTQLSGYWKFTYRDQMMGYLVFTGKNNEALSIANDYKNKYVIKRFVISQKDSSLIIDNQIEQGVILKMPTPDSMILASTKKHAEKEHLSFKRINEVEIISKLNQLISFGGKNIESFNQESLWLVEYKNQFSFFNQEFKKVIDYESVLPVDSIGFFIKRDYDWVFLNQYLNKDSIITEEFSKVIKADRYGFALQQSSEKDSKWGYFRPDSKLYIKPQYDEVLYFDHELLPVRKGKYWSLLSEEGRNNYPKLSFLDKPKTTYSFWEVSTKTEDFEIKAGMYKRFKKTELKNKSNKSNK
jgi:hypothetical protein